MFLMFRDFKNVHKFEKNDQSVSGRPLVPAVREGEDMVPLTSGGDDVEL
jgi:hypothetical protein